MQAIRVATRSVVVLLYAAFYCASAAAADFRGTWQGFIHSEQIERPFILRIGETGSPWHVGVVLDDDWGNVWPAEKIRQNGDTLEFSVPIFGNDSLYRGHLSGDGGTLEGVWTAGVPLPLTLRRAEAATLWHETPHTTQFIEVDRGVKLEVLDWGGRGRALVMLPGAGLTAHLFSQFAAELTSHYHVYGITRRGSGASSRVSLPGAVYTEVSPGNYELHSPPHNPYDVDRLADDIVQVLNGLHLERPILVGHSIAGEELTAVASRYPQRVAGLIYLDAFAEYAFSDGQRYDALFTPEHPLRVQLAPDQRPRLDDDTALMLGMHEFRSFPPVPALAIFALPHHIPGLTGASRAAFDANQRRAIDRMNRIRTLLPGVRVVQYANADHMVWESNGPRVLEAMNAFIATLPRPSPAAPERGRGGGTLDRSRRAATP